MANYCSAEDVQVLLGFDDAFTTSSIPTLAQVNSIITDVTNEIDFTLKSIGITVQPSDTLLLGRLAIACKYGTACQVGMSGFGNNTSVNDSQPGYYCTQYQAILDDIKDNKEAYGVVTGDETSFLSSNVIDGTNTEAEINDNYIDQDFS